MKKSTIKLISIIILILLIIGTGVGVIGYFSDGFKNWDKFNFFKKPPATEETQSVGGSVLKPIMSNGVAFDCKRLTTPPENTDSAYTLTATITPDILENSTIIWSVKFSNLSSAWANGKEISDYLTLDKTVTNSGEQVIVICKQDFGEQILITASAEADATKKALCTVDYRKRIKDISYAFSYGGESVENVAADEDGVYRVDYTNINKNYTIVPTPIYSNYTIDVNYSGVTTGKFNDTFGFGSSVELKDIILSSGAFQYNEPDLSEDALKFIGVIDTVDLSNQNSLSKLSYALTNLYPPIPEAEKQHPKVVLVYQALQEISNNIPNWQNIIVKLREDLKNYQPKSFFSFMNVDVQSFENFLQNSYACNKANKGVVEYVTKYSSGDFVFEFKLSLGFTKSSLQSFTNIDLDTGEIII